jgi:hypothetical protein
VPQTSHLNSATDAIETTVLPSLSSPRLFRGLDPGEPQQRLMDVAKAVQRFLRDAEALAHSNLSADRPAFTLPFWVARESDPWRRTGLQARRIPEGDSWKDHRERAGVPKVAVLKWGFRKVTVRASLAPTAEKLDKLPKEPFFAAAGAEIGTDIGT